MTMTNMNPETGVRYGIISANSLDPEIIFDIQTNGKNVRFEEAQEELYDAVKRACKDFMCENNASDAAQNAVDLMEFEEDEPIHEFTMMCEGYGIIKGRTTWLGGALLVWIFESPFTHKCKLCSPCVPNAGDLDSPDPAGCETYAPPADWYDQSQL